MRVRSAIRIAAAIAALALGACAGRQQGSTREGARDAPVIRSVRLTGVEAVDADELREGLSTKPTGRWPWSATRRLDRLALTNDELRIETYYGLRGYFETEAEHAVEPDGDGVRVIFRVREGPVSRVRALRLPGLDAVAPEVRERVTRDLPLEPGEPVRARAFDATRALLDLRLRQHGHAAAEVEGRIEVHPEDEAAEVVFDVAPGPVHRYGDIAFEGLEALPDGPLRSITRRHLPRGRRFRPSDVDTAQARLTELNALRSVRLRLDPPSADGLATVRVQLEELPIHSIVLGGGLGVEQNFQQVQATVEYRHRNLLGGAEQLAWRNQLAFRFLPTFFDRERTGLDGESTVELTFPDALPRADLAARAGYGRIFRQAFEGDAVTARLALARFLGPRSRITPALAFAWYPTLDTRTPVGPVPPSLALPCPSPCQIASVGVNGFFDTRNDLLMPRRGYVLLGDAEYAFPLPNGGAHLVRLAPEARAYFPVGSTATLALRGQLGAIFTVGATDRTPLPVRFFGGGEGGHRGFGAEQLAPTVEEAGGGFVPIGGEGSWLVTVEPRFRLTERWEAVVFVDAGDVTAEPLRIDPTNAPVALGAGARLITAAGPIRLDLAYRVAGRRRIALDTGRSPDERPLDYFSFFLSLGEAF